MSKFGQLNTYESNSVGIKIGRSVFNLPYEHKTTFNSGYWFPVFCVETLPGDTFEVNLKELVRMLSPVTPTMDNAYLDLAAFYVPFRLATRRIDDWKDICSGSEPDAWANGFDKDLITTSNVVHLNAISAFNTGSSDSKIEAMSLANYLGMPIGVYNCNFINALPFSACVRIWNEWMRDENVTESFDFWSNGADTLRVLTKPLADVVKSDKVFGAYKMRDYFTSALPATQKGGAVAVPLGDSAPLMRVGSGGNYEKDFVIPINGDTSGGIVSPGDAINASNIHNYSGFDYGVGDKIQTFGMEGNGNITGGLNVNNFYADLSQATGATVNAIRMSFALQRLQEKLARGGSRYNEFLKAVFGVTAPAGMIEMSEYIGGGRVPININQVLQTSSTTGSSPLGDTGAFSNTYNQDIHFTKSFVDYGYMIVMATVRPVPSYSQGIPLMFRKFSPLDIYSPTFAFIGEQPIYTEEIYYKSNNSRYDNVGKKSAPNILGYKEAWSEYRNSVSLVTGNFAPASGDKTLAAWTYTENFSAAPTLSDAFLVQSPNNIAQTLIDVETKTQFIGDFVCNIKATRPLPVRSIPGLIDHY